MKIKPNIRLYEIWKYQSDDSSYPYLVDFDLTKKKVTEIMASISNNSDKHLWMVVVQKDEN
jgi:hypothetical protein